MQKIGIIQDNITDCERRRIFQYLSQWLQSQDFKRTLTID